MDEDEEQVVGAMAWCETCGEQTVHVDGECRDHKVVRRKKPRPKRPLPSPPKGGRSLSTIIGGLAIVLVVVGYFVITRLPMFQSDKPAAAPAPQCDAEEAEIMALRQQVAALQAQLAELRK